MAQQDITILRVQKSTRNRLKSRAITKRESYDDIINRLLASDSEMKNVEQDQSLESKKQRLLKIGISKGLVDLLGVIPTISLEEEKSLVRQAIIRRMGK